MTALSTSGPHSPHALVQRHLTTELLDLESPTYHEVVESLLDLRRFNRTFGGVRMLLNRLEYLLQEDGPASPLRLLDVATGSADLPLSVLSWSRKRGFDVEVTALERNPRVTRFVGPLLHAVPQVSLVRGDALRLPLRPSRFHYALCSLFLHQLDEEQSVELLRQLLEQATRAVIVNDLRRDRLHYAAAWLVSRTLSRSAIIRNDAPASVRNAYTSAELRSLARRAGASEIKISRHWPFRLSMILRP
ncbi:MAG: hypothetical protein V3S71_08780 [Acidobacteriota bacterium]